MQPYIALADHESDGRLDIFAGTQIANHLDARTHLGKNYVLLIHHWLFKLGVFCVAKNSTEFRAVEWVEQIHDASSTCDVLRPRLFHDVDARLKMFTCIVVENQGASFTRLILGCQRINKRTRERDHAPLTWQTLIHRAFKNSFCQFSLC